MYYRLQHRTTYKYSQPVRLKPHLVRLYPRSGNNLLVKDFRLVCNPNAQGESRFSDLDGNQIIKLWFDRPIENLEIITTTEVVTLNENPFNYLLEPWAITLPFDYPSSLAKQLQPYLSQSSLQGAGNSGCVTELADELLVSSDRNTLNFLFNLNQRIYEDCNYQIRDLGEAYPAGYTWSKRSGTCRDFAVLFMAVCQAVGIAARFVSGYQEGDPDQEARDLHAWVEVYLPGAGWRGYDPTLGLIVSDRHIPLAASTIPAYAAPVEGSFLPLTFGNKPTTVMKTEIKLSSH